MPSQTDGAWGGRRQSASQTFEKGRHGKRKARKVGSRPVVAVVEAKVLASGSKIAQQIKFSTVEFLPERLVDRGDDGAVVETEKLI